MKILVKYATRGRPLAFLTRLREWKQAASDAAQTSWLVSYDFDDPTMKPEVLESARIAIPGIVLCGGNSKTKIEAINADMEHAVPMDWEVVLLISDDMFCRRVGWDEMIRAKMAEHFPNTDGALWFHDGSKQREICTLSCIGRRMWERRPYFYHQSYASFWCDNEFTDVCRAEEKIVFIEEPIATHEHPAWGGGMKPDELYRRNNKYWAVDKSNYERRKAAMFPL